MMATISDSFRFFIMAMLLLEKTIPLPYMPRCISMMSRVSGSGIILIRFPSISCSIFSAASSSMFTDEAIVS